MAAKRKRYHNLMDELPHEVQKEVKRRDAELEKLGFCTLTGLPVGVTQEMFDEANRQVRMNRQNEDKDNELDRRINEWELSTMNTKGFKLDFRILTKTLQPSIGFSMWCKTPTHSIISNFFPIFLS